MYFVHVGVRMKAKLTSQLKILILNSNTKLKPVNNM